MNQNEIIAPCGMNCQLCYGYVRKKIAATDALE